LSLRLCLWTKAGPILHERDSRNWSRVTLVLFRRRALGGQGGAEQRIGARVRKSRQKEAAGAADAGVMQIEWSEGEVLKLVGVDTEAEEEVGEHVGGRIDGRKRCDRGCEVGIGSGAGRRGAERGEPCRVCELWGAVSCRSSDPQWWRTELDLSSSKSFDDRHRSTTLRTTPKRFRLLGGGGFWFDLRRNCAQCCQA
jgi:hypothetical protein